MEKCNTETLVSGRIIEVRGEFEGASNCYSERHALFAQEVATEGEFISGGSGAAEACSFTGEPVIACSVRNKGRRRCPYSIDFCGQ